MPCFPPASRLIDLGCGTGLDAVHLARRGHSVTATDWSPQMVRRTADRARDQDLADRVRALAVGSHELHLLRPEETAGFYDGAYSNLGPLNCVPDLAEVARQCARLLRPGGALVFTVIGRVCPWEIAHYALRRRWARVGVRFARGAVPVGMNNHTIWTRYYSPHEFFRPFERDFELRHFRGLCVFAPPPYLTWLRERHPNLYRRLWWIDRQTSGWPLLRGMGDHFLMIMHRK